MKTLVLILGLISAPLLVHAKPTRNQPVEFKVAPGGKVVYYIKLLPGTDSMGDPNMELQEGVNNNTSFRTLLKSRPSNDPRQNLTGFSNLALSPDAKTLYFETSAWATSNAIHALNISNGRVSYVTNGSLALVVSTIRKRDRSSSPRHRPVASMSDTWKLAPIGQVEIKLVPRAKCVMMSFRPQLSCSMMVGRTDSATLAHR